MMKRFLLLLFILATVPAMAQADRHDVRSGNRKFRRDQFKEAEISYRKGALKDSLSVTSQYNLANTLYKEQDYEAASRSLEAIEGAVSGADYHFNRGDVALAREDYAQAVEQFKQALLLNPGDMDAKENYIYAKKKLENQQNQGQNDQQQDQQDQQDQQNDQQQNQDQNQDQQDDRQDQQPPQPQESKISPQQAQQMLKAIQAQEKETQDKVNKEKAEMLKTKQKEKNW